MSEPEVDPTSGNSSGEPEACPSIRHVGGANLDQAFVWNVRACAPSRPRREGKRKRLNCEAAVDNSVDARARAGGGKPRAAGRISEHRPQEETCATSSGWQTLRPLVPVLAKHQTRKRRIWAYVRDDKPLSGRLRRRWCSSTRAIVPGIPSGILPTMPEFCTPRPMPGSIGSTRPATRPGPMQASC